MHLGIRTSKLPLNAASAVFSHLFVDCQIVLYGINKRLSKFIDVLPLKGDKVAYHFELSVFPAIIPRFFTRFPSSVALVFIVICNLLILLHWGPQ